MTRRAGLDTDVRRVMLGRVARFGELAPDAVAALADELHAPTPELVADLAVAFAAHERAVEQLIDVAPAELVRLVGEHLRELQQWSEAARLTVANTTIGTFHFQTTDAESLTVTRDGVAWDDRGAVVRYALAMFVATDASDLRAKTRAIPPHVVTRAVACASAYLAPK